MSITRAERQRERLETRGKGREEERPRPRERPSASLTVSARSRRRIDNIGSDMPTTSSSFPGCTHGEGSGGSARVGTSGDLPLQRPPLLTRRGRFHGQGRATGAGRSAQIFTAQTPQSERDEPSPSPLSRPSLHSAMLACITSRQPLGRGEGRERTEAEAGGNK